MANAQVSGSFLDPCERSCFEFTEKDQLLNENKEVEIYKKLQNLAQNSYFGLFGYSFELILYNFTPSFEELCMTPVAVPLLELSGEISHAINPSGAD